MIKHELLSPAGDMKSLHQAIANGADAVYVGCKSFGARKFAKNFNEEEIKEAIKLCHLYGVKIYVTMNTCIKDNEVNDFLKQIEYLHVNGVDAVIVQDFGMINLIRQKYPNLDVHASTQANAASIESVKLLKNLGVTRVVLPREMSLNDIESIDVPIEKEVFIHGALCISYSGCCLMSSMLGTRSGNRGECAGSCRLPYSLEHNGKIIEDNKYLLSTKELNTSKMFKEMLDSDIVSFKIEGRMKSPEYVGFITRYYRNLIDNYCKNNNLEDETNKLKTIFNRGFTTGNLFNATKEELMNTNTPNHIGLEIGKVIEVTDSKIKIKLTRPLNQQDGIRFLNSGKGFIVNYLYDEKDRLTSSADNICYVDNKVGLKELDKVCKTSDYKLMKDLTILPNRKVSVKFKVTALINKPLKLEVTDLVNSLYIEGNPIQKAISSETSPERIKTQIEKLGETPFTSIETKIESDEGIFISIKELNELRRTLINNLIEQRMNTKKEVIINDLKFEKLNTKKELGLCATVTKKEQLLECLSLNLKRIYVKDKNLYDEYKDNSSVYYYLPRCLTNPKDNIKEKNLVSEYFNFSKNMIGNYTQNVYNIYTAYYLFKNNLDKVTLSIELTSEEIMNFIKNYKNKFNEEPNLEILSYGKVENMIIKGNILSIEPYSNDYNLIDFKKRVFKVYFDNNNTHIYNYENKEVENLSNLKYYASLRLDFLDEDKQEVNNIVKKYE